MPGTPQRPSLIERPPNWRVLLGASQSRHVRGFMMTAVLPSGSKLPTIRDGQTHERRYGLPMFLDENDQGVLTDQVLLVDHD